MMLLLTEGGSPSLTIHILLRKYARLCPPSCYTCEHPLENIDLQRWPQRETCSKQPRNGSNGQTAPEHLLFSETLRAETMCSS